MSLFSKKPMDLTEEVRETKRCSRSAEEMWLLLLYLNTTETPFATICWQRKWTRFSISHALGTRSLFCFCFSLCLSVSWCFTITQPMTVRMTDSVPRTLRRLSTEGFTSAPGLFSHCGFYSKNFMWSSVGLWRVHGIYWPGSFVVCNVTVMLRWLTSFVFLGPAGPYEVRDKPGSHPNSIVASFRTFFHP
jgi:hypothetical protein